MLLFYSHYGICAVNLLCVISMLVCCTGTVGLYVYVITVTASSSVYDNTQLLDAVRYLNYTLFDLYDNSTWLLLDLVITSGRCVTQ